MSNLDSADPFNVVIAGGGVAAVEGAHAPRELGGDRIATTIDDGRLDEQLHGLIQDLEKLDHRVCSGVG